MPSPQQHIARARELLALADQCHAYNEPLRSDARSEDFERAERTAHAKRLRFVAEAMVEASAANSPPRIEHHGLRNRMRVFISCRWARFHA